MRMFVHIHYSSSKKRFFRSLSKTVPPPPDNKYINTEAETRNRTIAHYMFSRENTSFTYYKQLVLFHLFLLAFYTWNIIKLFHPKPFFLVTELIKNKLIKRLCMLLHCLHMFLFKNSYEIYEIILCIQGCLHISSTNNSDAIRKENRKYCVA